MAHSFRYKHTTTITDTWICAARALLQITCVQDTIPLRVCKKNRRIATEQNRIATILRQYAWVKGIVVTKFLWDTKARTDSIHMLRLITLHT